MNQLHSRISQFMPISGAFIRKLHNVLQSSPMLVKEDLREGVSSSNTAKGANPTEKSKPDCFCLSALLEREKVKNIYFQCFKRDSTLTKCSKNLGGVPGVLNLQKLTFLQGNGVLASRESAY